MSDILNIKKLVKTQQKLECFPWAAYNVKGVGNQKNDGTFSSYEINLCPGTINGLVPEDMFNTFTVGNTGTTYFIVTVQSNEGEILSAKLSTVKNLSSINLQTPTLLVPPPEFKTIVAIFHDGEFFRCRYTGISAAPQVLYAVDKEDPKPFETPQENIYIWVELYG